MITKRSTRITRFIFELNFEITRMFISRSSQNDKINLRREIFRIICFDLSMFILMKNFALRLFTTWACRVNLAISFEREFLVQSEINSSRETYSKQLCVAISMSRTVTDLSMWWIFAFERIFDRYDLSIKNMMHSEFAHNSFSDSFLKIRARKMTKCQKRKIKFLKRSDFVVKTITLIIDSSTWNDSIASTLCYLLRHSRMWRCSLLFEEKIFLHRRHWWIRDFVWSIISILMWYSFSLRK
jgi:hypothetical protein